MSYKLTPEQVQVVAHPLGCHARVLAVAGSGKSSTMAYRIKHLALDLNIRPNAIQVLMFNALARKQFSLHLANTGLTEPMQPAVHTFHSISFQVIGEAIKVGYLLANTQFWLADKSELIWLTLKRSITELEKVKRIPLDSVDPEEASHAISLWKGSLIPPQRAGSYTSPWLPAVYAQYEQLRRAQSAMTYDDFIPCAIDVLENNPIIHQKFCRELRHLIVDEYQDINLGQQHLIELLAGEDVDVMVVGDDDQTIYEWRGARPNFILNDFATVFNGKPVKEYQLSRSFRFGPLIAQCSANVIACNQVRVQKPLVSFQAQKSGFIQVFEGGLTATKELTEQVDALIEKDHVPPNEIIVLARMYAQLDNLEAEFLSKHIPYKVEGQEPFFKRREINALLDYIRLANDFQKPITTDSAKWLLSVANKPSRMLSRNLLERMTLLAEQKHLTTQEMLDQAPNDRSFGLTHWQAQPIQDLCNLLLELQGKLTLPNAGDLLAWMVNRLKYLTYFENYYGKGESADEKAQAVVNFVKYVMQLHLPATDLLNHLAQLDTTQGKPESELVVFTTIFRTKGLEYDFVILPQVDEGMMPYLKGHRADIFDTQGLIKGSTLSASLESERRLFYVALTRARQGVLIGTSAQPSRFLEEIQLLGTQPVMQILRRLASGNIQAKSELIQHLGDIVAQPLLAHNLLEGYLKDLNQPELAAQLKHAQTIPA